MNTQQTISNYKQSLNGYKISLEELEKKAIIEKNNLEHIIKQEEEIIKSITEKGINPDTLTATIEQKTNELTQIMNKLAQVIPADGSIPTNVNQILDTLNISQEIQNPSSEDINLDNMELEND